MTFARFGSPCRKSAIRLLVFDVAGDGGGAAAGVAGDAAGRRRRRRSPATSKTSERIGFCVLGLLNAKARIGYSCLRYIEDSLPGGGGEHQMLTGATQVRPK